LSYPASCPTLLLSKQKEPAGGCISSADRLFLIPESNFKLFGYLSRSQRTPSYHKRWPSSKKNIPLAAQVLADQGDKILFFSPHRFDEDREKPPVRRGNSLSRKELEKVAEHFSSCFSQTAQSSAALLF
jgi:hypothetical protein